jgi:hypothetical protein
VPEFFDLEEAMRLHADANALVAETEAGFAGDPEIVTRRMLAEEQTAGDADAEDVLRRAIAGKEEFYREIAALWKMMGQGADRGDMGLVRGAHAGIRALAMNELSKEGGV